MIDESRRWSLCVIILGILISSVHTGFVFHFGSVMSSDVIRKSENQTSQNYDWISSFPNNITVLDSKVFSDGENILITGTYYVPTGMNFLPFVGTEPNSGTFVTRQNSDGQFERIWTIGNTMVGDGATWPIITNWDYHRIYVYDAVSIDSSSIMVVGCFSGEWSWDGQIINSSSGPDGFIGRLSSNSSESWVETFGSDERYHGQTIHPECATDIESTDRGTFIIGGSTNEDEILNQSLSPRGLLTPFILEIDSQANVIWSTAGPIGVNNSIMRGLDWSSEFNRVVISTETGRSGIQPRSAVSVYLINSSGWSWHQWVPDLIRDVYFSADGDSLFIVGTAGRGNISFSDNWNYLSVNHHTWLLESSSYQWEVQWLSIINGTSSHEQLQMNVDDFGITYLTQSPTSPPITQLSPENWSWENKMIVQYDFNGDLRWVHGIIGASKVSLASFNSKGPVIIGDSTNLSIEASNLVVNGTPYTWTDDVPRFFFIWHMSDIDNDGIAATRDDCVGVSNWTSNSTSDYDIDGCRDTDEDFDDDNDSQLDIFDICRVGEKEWLSNNTTDYDDDGCQDSSEDDDDDNDLVIDEFDRCQFGELGWLSDPTTDFDRDGCRDLTEDNDDDSDGIDDNSDNCPMWPNTNQTNYDEDQIGDACDDDDDSDGVADELDLCPFGWIGWLSNYVNDRDEDGCSDSTEDFDDDNDGVLDIDDKCFRGDFGWISTSSTDYDGDGCKDSTEDSDDDADGIIDVLDSCPLGIINWNPNFQNDFDSDGCIDESEDSDDDADGISDSNDDCPFSNLSLSIRTDRDSDGCLDEYEDNDDDNDGMPDLLDWCQNGANNWQSNNTTDRDFDGCRDSTEDSDDDNDGIEDNVDLCPNIWVAFEDDENHDGCLDISTDVEQNPKISNQENSSDEANFSDGQNSSSVNSQDFSWIDVVWILMFGIPIWMMISYRQPSEKPAPPKGYEESE